MELQDFSYEFDILYNNIMSNAAPGISEYEKSVFLTQAQEQLVLETYTGKNALGNSFEKTEECRRYLDVLVKTANLTEKQQNTGISANSVFFELPKDLWFITYESVLLKDSSLPCGGTKSVLVKPITQDDYYKASQNPFRQPNERRVLRLDISNRVAELISKYNIDTYTVRYLEKPEPIVLEDLGDISIEGVSQPNNCKLSSALHRQIVERAVQIAVRTTAPNTIQGQN